MEIYDIKDHFRNIGILQENVCREPTLMPQYNGVKFFSFIGYYCTYLFNDDDNIPYYVNKSKCYAKSIGDGNFAINIEDGDYEFKSLMTLDQLLNSNKEIIEKSIEDYKQECNEFITKFKWTTQ